MNNAITANKSPNFFIVGAAKSGTSSLWKYLKENQEVFMPDDELYKEPSYFSISFELGIDWYLDFFKKANPQIHKVIGEASTSYLTHPEAAQRIYEFNRQSKIIIILRNPAERAYSLYRWMVQDGYEYAGTFERALILENKRINKKIPNYYEPEYYYNYLYFNSGLYYEQVKRYLDLFGNSVLIVKFDDFKNDLKTQYKRVCHFLGVQENVFTPEIHNISKSVYSAKLQFVLRKINDRLIRQKAFKTKKERDALLEWGTRSRNPTRMNDETKKMQLKSYEKDIRRLSKLTDMNFDDWMLPRADG